MIMALELSVQIKNTHIPKNQFQYIIETNADYLK